MTCTVTLALPGLNLTAADTRLNLRSTDGSEVKVDGPDDINLVLKSGASLVLPYHYRKLRRIAEGWMAGTGDFVAVQLVLERLHALGTLEFEQLAHFWETERDNLRTLARRETGVTGGDLDQTTILIATHAAGPKVLALHFSMASPAIAAVGNYVITWPPDLQLDVSRLASTNFEQAVNTATDVHAIVKSAIEVVRTAAQWSWTVGPQVQVGFTTGAGSQGARHFYLSGDASSLAQLSDVRLQRVIQNAA